METALIVFDMQGDFCHLEGVYQRLGKLPGDKIAAIIPNIRRVMEAGRKMHFPIIATKFTIFTGLQGEAIGLGHIGQLRPFLQEEGFRQNSPGHRVISELPEPDYEVEKTRFSAFYSSPLEALLRALKISRLVLTGIATNGAVEATARDALMRDFELITLSDCVTSFNADLHQASLLNLAAMGRLLSSSHWLEETEASNLPPS